MYDKTIRQILRQRKLLTAPPDISVAEAARRMAKRQISAIVVTENDSIIEIVTERDIVFRAAARGLDLDKTRIAQAMTPSPQTIEASQPLGMALLIMHENGFRHLPVVDNGKLAGILSARNALDPELEDFVSEARRREYLQSERMRGSAGTGDAPSSVVRKAPSRG